MKDSSITDWIATIALIIQTVVLIKGQKKKAPKKRPHKRK